MPYWHEVLTSHQNSSASNKDTVKGSLLFPVDKWGPAEGDQGTGTPLPYHSQQIPPGADQLPFSCSELRGKRMETSLLLSRSLQSRGQCWGMGRLL